MWWLVGCRKVLNWKRKLSGGGLVLGKEDSGEGKKEKEDFIWGEGGLEDLEAVSQNRALTCQDLDTESLDL